MATRSVTNEKRRDLAQGAEKEAEIANGTGPGNETEASRDLLISMEMTRMDKKKRKVHENATEAHPPRRFLNGRRTPMETDEVSVALWSSRNLTKSPGLVTTARWRRRTRRTTTKLTALSQPTYLDPLQQHTSEKSSSGLELSETSIPWSWATGFDVGSTNTNSQTVVLRTTTWSPSTTKTTPAKPFTG